jgi:hypothetical protein
MFTADVSLNCSRVDCYPPSAAGRVKNNVTGRFRGHFDAERVALSFREEVSCVLEPSAVADSKYRVPNSRIRPSTGRGQLYMGTAVLCALQLDLFVFIK